MQGDRIVVLGSAVVDRAYHVEEMPFDGATVRALSRTRSLGGKGANQAAAARRLGAEVVFVGRVGDDPEGAETRADLEGLGIVLELTTTPGQATGEAAILIDGEGRNEIALWPGASARLTARDADAARRHLESAAAFVGQFEVPLEATLRAAEIASEAEALTILNAAPASADVQEILPRFDIVVANSGEAEMLTGVGLASLEDALANLRALRDLGVREPIITLGAAGAVCFDRGRAVHVPALPVAEVVDPTGAGDAFVGALAALLVEGREHVDAVRGACRYAALSVTRPVTRVSYVDRATFDS
jgi:ribokinase